MSTYRLETLFTPRSIAIVGISPRPDSVGHIILKNLKSGGFVGDLYLVDPHHDEIDGVAAVRDFASLSSAPDLAVISVPATAVPTVVREAAEKGVGAAIIITAGLGHGAGSLAEAAEKAARTGGMRLLGPNCLGLLHPTAKLNASFAAHMPQAGSIALISQSGAVAAGMVAWASQRSVGFSAIASIGDMIDIDFGDLLDFFALDPATHSILLYIESIKDARKFMSAARSAARTKPIIAIKAGRHAQAATAAATHTGALAGSDAVYDAALRRAGILRVLDLDEFFDAAETLARLAPFAGNRLAILTNGGGLGVLAVDRLSDLGGNLAALSAETKSRLDAVLPEMWSKSNPVDIVGDADPGRYGVALEALLADRENDAVLVIQVPTALSLPVETARKVTEIVEVWRSKIPPKPILCAWIGEEPETSAIFSAAKIPHYTTEKDAVNGFMHLVRYRQAQDALMAVPPSLPDAFVPDVTTARKAIEGALREKRRWLDPMEVTQLFGAYQIPIASALAAKTPDEAGRMAELLLKDHAAVAVKVFSRDITHKSDVGGVELNLRSSQAVREAANAVLSKARAARPDAHIEGVTIHPMIVRSHARELIAGIAEDPTFGPVIVFGCGGTAVEVINDKALALPPLDLNLACDLVASTRVSRLLKGYRNVPAVDESGIALVLMKLAQMSADIPEIVELDINPLLANEAGVIAIDARVAVAPAAQRSKTTGNRRFAIRPYPKEWERRGEFGTKRKVFFRPIRPEDESELRKFLEKITLDDLRLRFFAPMKNFSGPFLVRLTQLDYARAMAFVAIDEENGEFLGVVRLYIDANFEAGEYAVLVRSDLKGQGLGWKLMELIIEYARSEGLKRMEGEVLADNTSMLKMCHELGFQVTTIAGDTRRVKLPLQ